MKVRFSRAWIRSVQRRKQRKYSYNAPMHLLQKFMGVHLSKELKQKHGTRNITVKKGDSVKIVRGHFSGKTGKVDSVDLKRRKVFIAGVDATKKDGTKRLIPVNPSNLIITELDLADKRRRKIIERKKKQNGKKTP